MAIIDFNSISGINSITAQSNALNFFTATGSTLSVGANVNATGVSTFNNVTVGGATTALVVNGNARITGILTVGTGSITINPITDSITGVTTLGVTTAYISAVNDGPLSGARNRIINGDMRIDQRNNGASITPTSNTYCVDRWMAIADASSKYSIQRVSDGPTGFPNSVRLTSLSAYTPGSGEIFGIWQVIEGFNIEDLMFGTSSARTISVSFWVKSSLTGTFGGGVLNNDYTRGYPFSYVISSANTWEYKTVTIPGSTNGTWLSETNRGLVLFLGIGAASNRSNTAGSWSSVQYSFYPTGGTNLVSTNGATFNITGVQLEVGSVATPFERRSYGQELALCQRYCYCVGDGMVYQGKFNENVGGNAPNDFRIIFPTTMRSSPTLSGSYSISGAFGVAYTYFDRNGFYYCVLRSGFAWVTDDSLKQSGNFILSSEL